MRSRTRSPSAPRWRQKLSALVVALSVVVSLVAGFGARAASSSFHAYGRGGGQEGAFVAAQGQARVVALRAGHPRIERARRPDRLLRGPAASPSLLTSSAASVPTSPSERLLRERWLAERAPSAQRALPNARGPPPSA